MEEFSQWLVSQIKEAQSSVSVRDRYLFGIRV